MNEITKNERPYLASDETTGRSKLSQRELFTLENIHLIDEKTPSLTDEVLLRVLGLSEEVCRLAARLVRYVYAEDGVSKVMKGLTPADIHLLRKINLSPQEVALILRGDSTVEEFAYLHLLRSFEERADLDKRFRDEMGSNELDWPFSAGDYGREYNGSIASSV